MGLIFNKLHKDKEINLSPNFGTVTKEPDSSLLLYMYKEPSAYKHIFFETNALKCDNSIFRKNSGTEWG